jgi:hypothetical protein
MSRVFCCGHGGRGEEWNDGRGEHWNSGIME